MLAGVILVGERGRYHRAQASDAARGNGGGGEKNRGLDHSVRLVREKPHFAEAQTDAGWAGRKGGGGSPISRLAKGKRRVVRAECLAMSV